MLQCDSDNVILGKVSSDGCETLADLVGLICLQEDANDEQKRVNDAVL